jgi:FdhD protein
VTTSRRVDRLAYRSAAGEPGFREVAEESAVAIVVNGVTMAVLMATPADLADLGVGFAMTEGVIGHLGEVEEVNSVEQANGWEVRLTLPPEASARAEERRRALIGPSGCGLCGVESLAAAATPAPRVQRGHRFTADQMAAAVAAIRAVQPLGVATRAVHAAALWAPAEGMIAAREDVGRHNALDKLAGALLRAGQSAADGIVVLTSRVSVEMVQKAARIGAQAIAAVSAPTALAIRTAEAADLTLVAVARDDGFELFTGVLSAQPST